MIDIKNKIRYYKHYYKTSDEIVKIEDIIKTGIDNKHLNLYGLELISTNFAKFTSIIAKNNNLSVKLLYITSSNIPYLPSSLFKSFMKLECLVLTHCNLSRIPNSLYECKQLNVIDLSYNNIANIDYMLGSLIKLRFLNIASNSFVLIPTSIYKLVNLAHFQLEWFKGCNVSLPSKITQQYIYLIKTLRDNLKIFHEDEGVLFIDRFQFISIFDKLTSTEEVKHDNKFSNLIENSLRTYSYGWYIATMMIDTESNKYSQKHNKINVEFININFNLILKCKEGIFLHYISYINGFSNLDFNEYLDTSKVMNLLKKISNNYDMFTNKSIQTFLQKLLDLNSKDNNNIFHYLFSNFNKNLAYFYRILHYYFSITIFALKNKKDINLLSKIKAKLNSSNSEGWNPIHLAVKRNQTYLLYYIDILNTEFEELATKPLINFDAIGKQSHYTPLQLAYASDPVIVTILLSNSVNSLYRNENFKKASQICKSNSLNQKLILQYEAEQCNDLSTRQGSYVYIDMEDNLLIERKEEAQMILEEDNGFPSNFYIESNYESEASNDGDASVESYRKNIKYNKNIDLIVNNFYHN